MNLNIQFQIKNNPNYQQYIRENSNWYKLLNRNPEIFRTFEEEVKERYKLRTSDRIGRVLENIELIQSIMSSFH